MKLHLKKPGKKIILVSSVIALGLVGGISAQVANKPTAEAGTSPLIQTVDKQGTELDNHEARITNTESDVKDLQSKTNTAPSTVRVPVPVVVSQPTNPETNTTDQTAVIPSVINVSKCQVVDKTTSQNSDGATVTNIVSMIYVTTTYSDGTTKTVNTSGWDSGLADCPA